MKLISDLKCGQAFTYDSHSKNGSRPIIYSAIGSHAKFAVPGTHSRTIAAVVVNGFTSPGPIWDPTLSAYYYSYTALSDTNGTFVSSDSSNPTAWLYFFGRWGDEQYPDSDGTNCTTLSVLPATSGLSISVTVTRTTSSQNPSTTTSASKTTSSGSAGPTGSSTTSVTFVRKG